MRAYVSLCLGGGCGGGIGGGHALFLPPSPHNLTIQPPTPPHHPTDARDRERLEYLQTKFHINPSDFLTFDAMRQAAQCVGRVIRSKLDYGLMIFADSRYNRYDKRTKLPKWILDCMGTNHLDLSTGDAMDKVKRFLKEMAQPLDNAELQKILLDEKKIADMGLAMVSFLMSGGVWTRTLLGWLLARWIGSLSCCVVMIATITTTDARRRRRGGGQEARGGGADGRDHPGRGAAADGGGAAGGERGGCDGDRAAGAAARRGGGAADAAGGGGGAGGGRGGGHGDGAG